MHIIGCDESIHGPVISAGWDGAVKVGRSGRGAPTPDRRWPPEEPKGPGALRQWLPEGPRGPAGLRRRRPEEPRGPGGRGATRCPSHHFGRLPNQQRGQAEIRLRSQKTMSASPGMHHITMSLKLEWKT